METDVFYLEIIFRKHPSPSENIFRKHPSPSMNPIKKTNKKKKKNLEQPFQGGWLINPLPEDKIK